MKVVKKVNLASSHISCMHLVRIRFGFATRVSALDKMIESKPEILQSHASNGRHAMDQ